MRMPARQATQPMWKRSKLSDRRRAAGAGSSAPSILREFLLELAGAAHHRTLTKLVEIDVSAVRPYRPKGERSINRRESARQSQLRRLNIRYRTPADSNIRPSAIG